MQERMCIHDYTKLMIKLTKIYRKNDSEIDWNYEIK